MAKGAAMSEVKEMPYSERYAHVLDAIRHDDFIPPFLEKRLGKAAADEFRRICEAGMRSVPADAPPEEAYEAAYANWMHLGSTAFSFVEERMGEEGIEEFLRADVEELKHENSRLSLLLLGAVRAASPDAAFDMVARKLAYDFQWLTPYSIEKPNKHEMVMHIPHCRLLDFPDSERLCLYGCRHAYPQWLAEQLKVKMEPRRQGTSCTIRFNPLH
jgi:hypothetical protein